MASVSGRRRRSDGNAAVVEKITNEELQSTNAEPLRAEQVAYELPNGSEGRAAVAAIPIADGGASLGSVILFEDTTRMANLVAEVAALKAKRGDDHGARGRR